MHYVVLPMRPPPVTTSLMQNALILGKKKKSVEEIQILFSYHSALKETLQALLGCFSSG